MILGFIIWGATSEIIDFLCRIFPDISNGVDYTIFEIFIRDVFKYIENGVIFLDNWFSISFLYFSLACVLGVESFFLFYRFLMWVLNKVPAISID